LSLEVDVVLDDHQIALSIVEIDSACGIGEDRGARAEPRKHANREGDFPPRVALVEMDAPLHDDDGTTGNLSQDELPRVANGRRAREMGNVGEADPYSIRGRVGKVAEPGTENDGDCRPQIGFACNKIGSLINLSEEIGSSRCWVRRLAHRHQACVTRRV
jgi:hypothetical protein